MQSFLITLGIILACLIVAYIIAKLYSGRAIVRTKISALSEIETDQYYYLPAYSITLTATASVTVLRSSVSKKIKSPVLTQLQIDAKTQVEPDTEQLLLLKYCSDWFSDDEVKITTGANGLLDNISVTAEDRIASVIAQFTGAVTQKDMKELFIKKRVEPEAWNQETLTFTKTFQISGNIIKSKEIPCEWQIDIDNSIPDTEPVNASFILKNPDNSTPYVFATTTLPFDGVLTRPQVNTTWDVHLASSFVKDAELTEEPVTSFTCLVPDFSRLLKLPLCRGYFIKKVQLPKFSNGLLIENYFKKPSEVEGLASIPINVAKAILSIPSALLQFKISHNKQRADYEKSIQDLKKIRSGVADNPPPPPGKTPDPTLDAINQKLNDLSNSIQQKPPAPKDEDTFPQLGKLPATEASKGKGNLAQIRKEFMGKEGFEAFVREKIDESCRWDQSFSGNWMSYNNEEIKDCVPAAGAHMVMAWTSYTKPAITRITEQDVIAAYAEASDYNPNTGDFDRGCSTVVFLRNWEDTGMGDNRILRSAPLQAKNKDELKQAISWFGPCMVGFQLCNSVKTQKDVWEVTSDDEASGLWGGHAVAAIGYDPDFIYVISWGRPVKVKWDFFEHYNDEGFAVLSDDWFKDNKTPGNQDLAQLNSIMDKIIHKTA